jgi:hypothetical protein
MKRLSGLLFVLGSCASAAPLEEWGRACEAEMNPAARLDLVRKIIATGDQGAIPVLIDCLAAVRRRGKPPDRVYGSAAVIPNETAPPEFWALYIVTGQDFDLDVEKWRAWYDLHRGRLAWDGGRRRFFVK